MAASRAKSRTRPGTGGKNVELYRGVAWGVLFGCLGIAAVFLSGVSVVFPLLALVVLPFAAGVAIFPGDLVSRLMYASVLVFTLELLLGGAGNWLTIFGLPIRYLLLLGGLFFGGLYAVVRRELDFPRFETALVVIYGAVLPFLWLAYSVLVENNSPGLALDSAGFLGTLLLYFPLFLALRHRGGQFAGLLTGVLFVLSVAFLFAPLAAGTYTGWFSGNVHAFPNGFSRVSLNAHVLLPAAMVCGLLYLADTAQPALHRIAGSGMLLASTLALALTFTRGIFSGVALVLVGGLVAGLFVARTRPLRWRALGAGLLLIPISFVVMFYFSPGGAARFFNLPADVASLAPESPDEPSDTDGAPSAGGNGGEEPQTNSARVRQEQQEVLVARWREEPVLGNGAGAMPERYEESGRTDFELEYHALLYRSGVVGVAAATVLLAFLGLRYLAVLRWDSETLFSHRGKVAVSVLVAALVIAVVGYVNPVLTSAYFGLLVALYLALNDSLGEEPDANAGPGRVR